MKVIVNRPAGTAYALVESPLQLLCAVEAHFAGLLGVETRLLVRDDVPGLDAALVALRHLELPGGLSARSLRPHEVAWRRTPVHAVGDACSGLFQALLLMPGRVPRLTLYDDGLDTLDTVTRLNDASSPLVRPGGSEGRLRNLLGTAAARALRRLARAEDFTLFTALRLPDAAQTQLRALGVRVTPNTFDWLRSRPHPEVIDEPTVVIGSGLVADGLIDADAYVDWVAQLSGVGSPILYVPHRRNLSDVVDRLDALPGVRIAQAGAPVEVRLRGLAPPQRVVCLPTTAALLLAPLLAPRGVPVVVHDVPESWWTTHADPALREHLRTVIQMSRIEREPTA